MTSWAQLEAFLKMEAAKIGPAINAIAQFFKPMAVASLEEIATAALNSVMAEAPKVLAGTEKFANAVSNVITTAGQNGKVVAASLAETAVQAAYNTLSTIIHPVPPPPASGP
jgi:hypothetical protein